MIFKEIFKNLTVTEQVVFAICSVFCCDSLRLNISYRNSRLEDTVVKIIDLQEEINSDIDKLVDLKRDIVKAIKRVKKPEYQILLELRYLCFKTWEEIAVKMNCSIDNVFKMRNKALKIFEILES